ncbi:hypothetical protein A2165_00775 [Candidatus Curtissbacteria bacterium RBG_13_40_7]|uniref:Uncharacterized protein n=1 Tax=Candidatus Curtissbacteria bacterium RBG_13_40_7 TaxID=1797706 RepID=A0A1F5FUF7_9BACT|nr:MAG: hypothetical protein A2165_00775 [Candidatus Curtissbacteria bacterium RBG_13_40_7]
MPSKQELNPLFQEEIVMKGKRRFFRFEALPMGEKPVDVGAVRAYIKSVAENRQFHSEPQHYHTRHTRHTRMRRTS